MKQIKNFDSLTAHLKELKLAKRVVAVWPSDKNTEEAIIRVLQEGWADFILVGPPDILDTFSSLKHYADHVSVVGVADCDEAAREAVKMVRDGDADVVMKGLVNTDNLLHAVLNKETGLLPKGKVLTHMTVMQGGNYGKFLFFSDAAVIPSPTFDQLVAMVSYAVESCRAFGVERPRVALIHYSEKINPKFPVTTEYAEIKRLAAAGEFGDAVIDGPMDIKTACDAESAQIKGIASLIEGQADALIFPDLEAANVFYKTMTLFCKADNAGVLRGPIAPVVLPSRSDSAISKYYSLAVACLIS